MENIANTRSAADEADDILADARLPNAPLAVPKQVLEVHMNWLFSIYARLLRRV